MTEPSDGPTYNQLAAKRLQQELDEFHNDPIRLAQAQIDHWLQSQRDSEFEEADVYEVGGFQEHFSTTPSYTK